VKKLLPNSTWTRPGDPLWAVNGVIMHYVDWPMVSANRVREYFAESVPKERRYASAHYIVGIPGDIIQCIPEDEVAYHAGPSKDTSSDVMDLFGGYPNWHAIGIEMCHPSPWGAFSEATIRAAVDLVADICVRYDINPMTQVLRHYDCTGKRCPAWWVDNPGEFHRFKNHVLHAMKRKALA